MNRRIMTSTLRMDVRRRYGFYWTLLKNGITVDFNYAYWQWGSGYDWGTK